MLAPMSATGLSAATSAQKDIAAIVRTTELVALASTRSANFASPSLPTSAEIAVAEMVAATVREFCNQKSCVLQAVHQGGTHKLVVLYEHDFHGDPNAPAPSRVAGTRCLQPKQTFCGRKPAGYSQCRKPSGRWLRNAALLVGNV
jgi:hypothetical protein